MQSTMTTKDILNSVGQFSSSEMKLFEEQSARRILNKNEVLLSEGEVCRGFYFIVSGSFFQYRTCDVNEIVVDLHIQNEWMFNQQSLTEQVPSSTTIKSYSKSEVVELSLKNFHYLCSRSQSFLQFGKILNQTKYRTELYDSSLSPAEKYAFIRASKPGLTNSFPLKMIASYLKIAPETLSRVRGNS